MKPDADALYILVNLSDVNYVNRIMEGYEHLGVVTTLDRARGVLMVRATADTKAEAREILAHLPVPVRFINHNDLDQI